MAMMAKSQDQSLNEDVVFLPNDESNPEFLHSEVERSALEALLRDGPGAFYTKLSSHRLEPFLSQEEVNQVSGWVQDLHVEIIENGDIDGESGSCLQDCSDEYFPEVSDVSAPCLELGWPEKDRWNGVERTMIYTNPPVEQAPHIREVIRRLIQGATMLIAIVADRVTDSLVIGDLQSAASRGVRIYVILNRRPAQANLTPSQLKHSNIVVRILDGNKFMCGDGKTVVGDMKENFVLVDLQTVVLGSYSLTWTDAHLHRHLVTVLSGPVVESFDREFRILYAASQPVPDSWKADRPAELLNTDRTLNHPEPHTKHPELFDCPASPPPPIADSPIDWEALGFFQTIEDSAEDQVLSRFSEEPPRFQRTEPIWDIGEPRAGVANLHITEWQDESKLYHVPAEQRHVPDHQLMFRSTPNPDRFQYGFLTDRDDGPSTFRYRDFRMDRNLKKDPVSFLHTHRQDGQPRLDRSRDKTMVSEETPAGADAAQGHQKKPLIVSIPMIDSTWNLGEFLKRASTDITKDVQTIEDKSTISKSTLDLSAAGTETLQRSHSQANLYESFPITPALALMKKRNEEVKYSLLRHSKVFQPLSRPRSYSVGLKRDPWKSTFLQAQNNEQEEEDDVATSRGRSNTGDKPGAPAWASEMMND